MSKRLLHIVSLLLCVACVFNMSAQEAMDSVTIDSILSARYPRIHPVYLDSTQIAEQASSINVPVVSSAEYSETPTSVSLDFNKSVGQIPIKSGTSPSGAKTGGTINGIVAKINGRNFWTGAEKNSAQKIIEAYNEGTFSNAQEQIQQDVDIDKSILQNKYNVTDRAYENFERHYNSHNRNADLNLSTEQIKKHIVDVIRKYEPYLRQGDTTMQGTINGIPKTIKINILGTNIRSINLYPGYSKRANLENTIIKFGDIIW